MTEVNQNIEWSKEEHFDGPRKDLLLSDEVGKWEENPKPLTFNKRIPINIEKILPDLDAYTLAKIKIDNIATILKDRGEAAHANAVYQIRELVGVMGECEKRIMEALSEQRKPELLKLIAPNA